VKTVILGVTEVDRPCGRHSQFGTAVSVVNQDLTFKAKAKDLTLKTKDLTSEQVEGLL